MGQLPVINIGMNRRKRRSGLQDDAITRLLDDNDLGKSDISGGSDDSDTDITYMPETETDADAESSEDEDLVEVQPEWGDHPQPGYDGDDGPGQPTQVDGELSSDEDGRGEPSKSRKVKGAERKKEL